MVDTDKARALDYRGVPAHRVRYIETEEGRRWRHRRVIFRVGLVLFFLPIAFYFWPNLIMFGKLTPLSPADFVETVNRDCVPVVRAMKEYERDTGRLPENQKDLVPRYLASHPPGVQIIGGGSYGYFTKLHEMIEYDFLPGSEGWSVHGPFANGPIPLPAVTIAPRASSSATAK